ncbi:MAG TPA: DNA repair protein RadC [Rubricoccaceae bacterium]|nr:DNA repair protein RadC [Rubricoccaceae bacterium]
MELPSAEPEVQYDYVPLKRRDEAERPREKLLQHGPAALSDAELIALLFGSGTRVGGRSVSAVELGQALLRAYGSLAALARRDARQLMRTKGLKGVGLAKAAQLAAACEIGRRVEAAGDGERVQVKTPADVAAVYGPRLRDLKREVFVVVFLNTANVILGDHTVSEGGLAASIVEPRAVFQRAVLENAAAVICLHNHPSGNPEPSREDVALTKQLVEAGKLMGIPVHDHLVIAGRTYTSLAERGLM